MPTSSILDAIVADWATWLCVAIGAGCAFVVYWWINRVAARPLAAAVSATAPTEEPPAPAWSQRDPFVHGSAQEKRRSIRRKGNPVTVLVSDAKAEAPPARGSVLDRSHGGLRLRVAETVQPGTILSIRAAHVGDAVPWVQLEVRTCTRDDAGWELGCQYVKAPPSSVQWLFG
jgi:hypothetical protein